MAEGDTIVKIARRIESALDGQVIERVLTPHPRGQAAGLGRLEGDELDRTQTLGKNLVLHFRSGLALYSHLRMSGSWHVLANGVQWRKPRSGAWLVLTVPGVDVVQFGGPVLELTRSEAIRRDRRLAALGPDLLAPDFDVQTGLAALRSGDQHRTLGEALLDQRTLAGIGNVFKSEACFKAQVDPWSRLADLSDARVTAVVASAASLMRASVETGTRPESRAYRRAGRPCPRCGTPIAARKQGDDARTTYWCRRCQT